MKKATLQLDEVMTAYLEYAAAIEGKTVKNFVAKIRRTFNARHSSLKRVDSLPKFADREILGTVDTYEWQNRLPQSTTFSTRSSAARRCWNNMLANRAALA